MSRVLGRRRRIRFRWSGAVVSFVLAVAVLGPGLPAPPAHAQGAYRPPVDAPVVDPFRPPPHPYGPGNLGVDYGAAPGTPVQASAGGQVAFAGQVGGQLHVVVAHPDGLRTTYSFLGSVTVTQGQPVAPGAVLGTVGDRPLHFGVRSGDLYLDPEQVLAGVDRARLVPSRTPTRATEQAGRRLAEEVMRTELGGRVRQAGAAGLAWSQTQVVAATAALGTAVVVTVEAMRLQVATELGRLGHLARLSLHLAPGAVLVRVSASATAWTGQACTPVRTPPPRPEGRRIAVLVAGLGSSSAPGGGDIDHVDTATLGYAPGDVLRFSYNGGRTPDPDDGLAGIPASSYGPLDSQQDVHVAAERLRELLAWIAREAPGVPVDVLAHSQGGLVARLALTDPAGPPTGVQTLVTLGTPHQGAPLATGLLVVQSSPGGLLVGEAAELAVALDQHGTSLRQLAETSPVIATLAARPLPDGIHVTSVGSLGDVVVPAGRTVVPGAHNVVVADHSVTHGAIPASPAATREIALAIGRRPPTCRSAPSAVGLAAATEGTAVLTDGVALGLGILVPFGGVNLWAPPGSSPPVPG